MKAHKDIASDPRKYKGTEYAGWLVRVYINGVIHSKRFGASKKRTPDEALEAAIKWRDAKYLELGITYNTDKRHGGKNAGPWLPGESSSENTSGVYGVYVDGRRYYARLKEPNGRIRRVYRSWDHWGKEEALVQVAEAVKKAVEAGATLYVSFGNKNEQAAIP
jgi:hypothetical protein